MIEELRKACLGEEFDYLFLMSFLENYKQPRAVISRLLKSGTIERVKKGLYVFGDKYRFKAVSRPLLANLVYGPSYVSREFALSHYGMIPERVETVTSMTTQKNKLFYTTVGAFHYQHIHPRKFTVGVRRETIDSERHYLIATPEKALADLVALQTDLKTEREMQEHLIENMRVDEEVLARLDPQQLGKIAKAYGSPVVRLLEELARRF